VDIGKLREEALVLTKKGQDLIEKIMAGEEPAEKLEQAQAFVDEGGAKMDLAGAAVKASAQEVLLIDGLGSLTVATPKDVVVDKTGVAWKSLEEYLVSIAAMGDPAVRAQVEAKGYLGEGWQTKLLSEAVGAAGGFLVPIEYRPEIFQKAYEDSIVRPLATVLPMSVRQLQMPSLDQTITPDAPKSAFQGGMVFFWTEEGAPKTEVDLKFKLIDLVCHEYSGYLPVTNILIADSPISLETLIRTQFGKTSAGYEDWHFLNGSGVGQPQGVISAGATLQPNRAGANHIVWADIMAMLHNFQPGANGRWVIHHCCLEELLQLQDGLGNYMWIPNMRDGIPTYLMGYPIIWTEKVPALGTKGDIGLYDFSYYLIGDRQQPTIDSSIHYKFIENQTTFRLAARVDGQPWLTAPIMLMPAGTSSISPFVSLDVPAA